jgi:Tripartite tricarboxylate transporter TctB family
MIRIRNARDFCGGVLLVAIGVAAVTIARGYPTGSAARMGPGYFPDMLGMLLIAIGGTLVVTSLRRDGPGLPRWPWRPTVVVLGAVVLFGAIVPWAGLALSTVVLVFVASAASHEFRWREAAVSAVLLAVLAVSVFVVGLKVQLPMWPLPFQ